MRAFLTKALFKSLLPFSATLLAPWIQAMFTNHPSSMFYQAKDPHISFIPTISDQLEPMNVEFDVLSGQLPFETVKLTSQMEIVGYSSYFWFMMTMMVVEIITFSITRLAKRHSPDKQIEVEHAQQSSTLASLHSSDRLQQTFVARLSGFIVYIVKMVILYSLCYLVYTIVFAALCIACNTHHNSKQGSIIHQDTSFAELEGRALQEYYLGHNETTENKNHTRGERFLTALYPSSYETLFQTQMTVGAIILSPDHRTAFLARLDSGSDCSLQIIDISNRSAPNFLGSVSFQMTYTDEYPWGNSLALSYDKQVIFMATGSDLQIIDFSNLMSPIVVGSYHSGESILSISLSPSKNVAFLSTYNASSEDYSYALQAVNITVSQSPKIIHALFASGQPFKLFIVNETALSISTQGALVTFGNYTNQTAEPNEFSFQAFGPSHSPSPFLVQVDSDFQYVYWAAFNSNTSMYVLYYYNMSGNDQYLPFIDLSDSENSDTGEMNYPENLFISPDGRLLYYNSEASIQVFDISNHSNLIALPPLYLNSVNCLSISADEQTLLVSAGSEFYILQLLFNLEPNQVVSALPSLDNVLAERVAPVDSDDETYQLVLSSNGETLYMLSPTGVSVLDVSDPSNPEQNSLNFSQVGTQIALSPNDQILYSFAFSNNSASTNFTFYNTSNGQLISHFTFDNFGYQPYSNRTNVQSFLITPDGNTAIVIRNSTNFLILDISNPHNVSVLSNTSYSALSVISMALSKDGQTVFIAGIDVNFSSASPSSSLRVYDISTPSSPKSISNFDSISGGMVSMTLSYNGTIAYVLSNPVKSVDININELCILNIINMSSLETPALITSMNLNDNCGDSQFGPLLSLGPDLQVLAVNLADFFLYLDVSNPLSPTIMDTDDQPMQCLIASHDFRTMYAVEYDLNSGSSDSSDNSDGPEQLLQIFMVADVLPKYTIYLPSNSFSLGSPYSTFLNLLTMTPHGTYYPYTSYYKIVDVGIFSPSLQFSGSSQVKSLPTWISFDKPSGILTFSPTSASQVGSYPLSVIFSTQISTQTFISAYAKAGSSINQTIAAQFLVTLIELGYVDNELYVSSIFTSTDWSETIQEQDSEGLIQAAFPYANFSEVYTAMQALNNFLFSVTTQVTINPSLSLALQGSDTSSASSSITLSTLSLAPLSIVITLEASGTQPQFVTSYPFTASFSNGSSQISMTSSLEDINTALSQLVVFLNGSDYCNGTITAADDLNPTLNQSVFNISQYFFISSPPIINSTYFQNQLAKASPKTSTQFALQFDTSTFTDPTNQSLTLKLQMQDSSLQVPGWLELKGYTLTGTSPDQLFGREIALKIIVSNQYQSSEIEFTLDIGISLEYALQLVGTYGGGFITFVGFLVYATTIYNILFKKVYRYPKDFVISVGQEVSFKNLYPIPFVKQPLHESKIIIGQIERKIIAELRTSSKAKIASYFARSNSCQLDTDKLLNSIQATAAEVVMRDRTQLKLYTIHQKELITELIINHFKLKLLDSDEQKSTKRAFELIKKDLFHLVEFEKVLENRLCKFSVNKALLFAKLKAQNITAFTSFESEENMVHSSRKNTSMEIELKSGQVQTQRSLETELIPEDPNPPNTNNQNIDRNFLIEILEAYALRQHLVNANIVEVDIVVRTIRKIQGLNSLLRFFKLNLRHAGFRGETISGYGIKYRVQENLLFFSGAFNNNAKDATLVVQVVSRWGRILRELWLYGVEDEEERKSLVQGVL